MKNISSKKCIILVTMDVECILSINKNVRRRCQTCLCTSQRQVCESRNPNIFSVWVVHRQAGDKEIYRSFRIKLSDIRKRPEDIRLLESSIEV